MLIRKPPGIRPSEITDESVYRQRREFLKLAGIATVGALAAGGCDARSDVSGEARGAASGGPFAAQSIKPSPFSTDETPNAFSDITTYNNYWEFGSDKSDPSAYAGDLVTSPWELTVAGGCDKPGTYVYEDILAPHPLEERIYRLRCVEAWSMVIPWVGFPLADLLRRFGPNSRAKFIKFTTLYDPEQMPGQRRGVLDWPYVEGLTMAEAMHPLTLMAVGLYGKELPNQNGAPMRLVVPWKYGFKSIKSIKRIEFTESRPRTAWAIAAPREYGFYANVNPEVDHPRWSQRRERMLGSGDRHDTVIYNGYGEFVADLYRG